MGRRGKRKKNKRIPHRSIKTFWISWYASKSPLFLFCLQFVFLIILFYVFSLLPISQSALTSLIRMDACLSSVLLNGFGENSHIVEQSSLWSDKLPILTILPACMAVQFSWFFCGVVFAFPATLLRKILGVIVGVIFLSLLNLFRIISLYWIGVHYTTFFKIVHEQVWPIVLNIGTILILVLWISWAKRDDEIGENASS